MAHIRLYVRQSPEEEWSRAGNCWNPDEAARDAALLLPDVRGWRRGQIGAKIVGEDLVSEIFIVWPRPDARLTLPSPEGRHLPPTRVPPDPPLPIESDHQP